MRCSKENRYSITSSARASSIGGISRPSAFSLEVDHQLEFRRLHDWQVGRFPSKLMSPVGHFRQIATSAYSAACRDGERTASSPSASVAEIVVRTMSRASWAGHGRPRCMVARLSHMTTSPLRQVCT